MPKFSVLEHCNQKDFVYGSFTTYVTPNELVVRGILKKTHNYGLYMTIRRKY